ncbi:MAG: potassium channel family protein [Gammaproteobacteria bacterium]|nr:potassium channel family protein [Gammaproteobacteria bacterium]
MHVIKYLQKYLAHRLLELSARAILSMAIVYFGITWILLWAAGEQALLVWPDFVYWMLVTASTVGYGDLSPQTSAGKWIVALFVIPFGLGLFASVVGRIAGFVSEQWKKGVRGLGSVDVSQHILVLGWNGQRTIHLLKLLLREQELSAGANPIVLCIVDDIENPMPGRIDFVRANSYNDDEAMDRAKLAQARVIVIDKPDDNATMTTALYCDARNPDAHIIAYFRDDSLSTLLKKHCPRIECTPSVSVEMLSKSAFDPGSSALHFNLLNVENAKAQYSIHYPSTAAPTAVETLFRIFKWRHQATLIGVRPPDEDDIDLNPALDATVHPGATLYYIAHGRLSGVDWNWTADT